MPKRIVNQNSNLRDPANVRTVTPVTEGTVVEIKDDPPRRKRFSITPFGVVPKVGTRHTMVKYNKSEYWLKSSRIGQTDFIEKDWTEEHPRIEGWESQGGYLHIPGTGAPEVGWKLHVSSAIEDIDEVLRRASAYLQDAGVGYKVEEKKAAVQNIHDVIPKLLTVYVNDENIMATIRALDEALVGIGEFYDKQDEYTVGESGRVHMRYGGNRPLRLAELNDHFERTGAVAGPHEEIRLLEPLEANAPHRLFKVGSFVFFERPIPLDNRTFADEVSPKTAYGAYLVDNVVKIDTRENPNDGNEPLPNGLALINQLRLQILPFEE